MLRILFILFFSITANSQGTLMIDTERSYLNYDAKHFLHAWSGKNNNVSGVIVYENKITKIAIAAKVVDFDSGNSNRDAHSLEVLEALKFPIIKFYSDNIKYFDESIEINGKLEFHGSERNIVVSSTLDEGDSYLNLRGRFQIIPTEFSVTLPSFMLIEMEDYLNISFSLQFDK